MNENVVLLGVTNNYPFEYSANNSKNELISKALIQAGCAVSIVDGLNGREDKIVKDNVGKNNDITYYVFKKGGLNDLLRNAINTYRILKKERTNRDKSYLFIGYSYFPIYLFYVALAKLLGYKIVVIITEWHLFFENKSLFKKLDYGCFDYFFGYCTNGILPISDKIISKIKHFKKPMLKIPILADYDSIIPHPYLKGGLDEEYFLYCGDIAYFDIIEFTINSFALFKQKNFPQNLHLIVNGKPSDIARVQALIEGKGLMGNVIISTKLPFNKLVEEYQNALALLIPLRTRKQDIARFPHKIAEYLAVARPIIAGNVGEVSIYFSDRNTAYLASDFSTNTYSNLMEQVVVDRALANVIGSNGRDLGERNFHYLSYGNRILHFIKKL